MRCIHAPFSLLFTLLAPLLGFSPVAYAQGWVYKNGSPVVKVASDANGGIVSVFDNNGAAAVISRTTDGGDGGYFLVNGQTDGAFSVDGAGGVFKAPKVTLIGPVALTVFDANEGGDDSVDLGTNAINAVEILNETGATQSVDDLFTNLTGGGTLDIIETSTITAPSAGYVLVIGSGRLEADHANTIEDYAEVGVSADCIDGTPSLPPAQDNDFVIPAGAPDGYWVAPFSAQHIFVVSAGANTFCLVAEEISGTLQSGDESLSLLFIPTSYGSVDQTMPEGSVDEDDAAARQGGMTATEIAQEQAASIAANQARIDREVAQMQARMEALEAELGALRRLKEDQQ